MRTQARQGGYRAGLVAGLAGLFLISACTASSHRQASTSATRSSGATASTRSGSAASLTTLWPCLAGTGARQATGPATIPINIALMGSGPRTVVFSDQSDEDLCAWLPFARRLVRVGFRVALFDYLNAPADDLHAVATYLRAHAATTVALVGASEGAKASIITAASLRPRPNAVVSLSAESMLRGTPVAPAAARLNCPTLFVTAANDPYGAAAATPGFYRSAPAKIKQLVIVPGSAHGTALLSTTSVADTVVSFLQRHD